MNKNNEFTGRKILSVITLFCVTSFISLASVLNFETIVIAYNEDITQIRTMDYASDDQILRLANMNNDDVEITSKEQQDGVIKIGVSDTFPVNININGETISVKTTSDSAINILQKNGITLSDKDFLNVDKNEVITDSTDINVTRVTTQIIEEQQTISYNTFKRASSSLSIGETKVLTQGQNGSKVVKTEVVMHNGVEAYRNVIEENVVTEAVHEVLEYGSFNVNRGVTVRDGILTTSSGKKLTYSKVIDVKATAYSTEGWSSTKTASGTTARVGAIAVDPRVIPLGSKLYITSADGKSWIYGEAVAEDTGGAIKGNKIDLFFNTQKECKNFGVKSAKVYILS